MNHSLSKMMCLDIYLTSLSEDEYSALESDLESEVLQTPLLSWDIFSQSSAERLAELIVEQDKTQIETFAKKYNWSNDIETIFGGESYEAIIVTDEKQRILWVNKGFSEMTGYTKTDALKKTPRFLQGQKTSEQKRAVIRKKLSADLPFKEVIINHKKDGTPYKCEVRIFPLHSGENKTHYIALERQVS